MAGRPELDRDRIARWLCSPAVLDERGRIASWHNPVHPGFAYSEAAAIWLSWAVWRHELGAWAPSEVRISRVARALRLDLRARGAVGRDGRLYLFDTSLALFALARAARICGQEGPGELAEQVAGLERFLRADSPVLPQADGDRWSQRWGAHLARGAALLALAGRWMDLPLALSLARPVRARLPQVEQGGTVYVHALAYAAEGELIFRALGEPSGALRPALAAAHLAELQAPDGHLPAWSDGQGGARSDATAQAVRIWCAVDRQRYRSQADRALAFLARQQAEAGGIAYDSSSADLNTWASMFADQAACWNAGEAPGLTWI